jgi:phage FluMu protein Com
MPLSARLRDVGSTLECGRCGHLIIKKGGWFIAAYIFKCPECKGEVRLTCSSWHLI